MDIWNLNNTIETTFLLWRTSATKFRVVRQGQPLALLTNSGYILIDKKYLKILDALTSQLTFKAVSIIDEVQQLRFDNYLEITLLSEIRADQINSVNVEGLKIWEYANEYIFVSSALKQEFQNVALDDFKFTIGFSAFAGFETLQ